MNALHAVDFRDVLLGLYAPLILLALNAVIRYGSLLLGIVRRGEFRVKEHALWIVIVFIFIGLLLENTFYGFSRTLDVKHYLTSTMRSEIVIIPKLLYVVAGVFAAASYCSSAYDRNTLKASLLLSTMLWALATLASSRWL